MRIRNFAIIAHVDHGKSTLADRMLETAGVIRPGDHPDQFLDRNPISRERGITIKLAPVSFFYKDVLFNLIDTPGHIDFHYEVDRTLSCVEGVVLLVSAVEGIQAQTVSNTYKALEKDIKILPVINKIDAENADVVRVQKQIEEFLGVSADQILKISAKTGKGVVKVMDRIIEYFPNPDASSLSGFKALVFDSYYDKYKGVIAFVRVFSGSIGKGEKIEFVQAGSFSESFEVGKFYPDLKPVKELFAGDIGYICTKLKEVRKVQVGDTVVSDKSDDKKPLAGYRKVKPMVFVSVFPVDPEDFSSLKDAMDKLYLTDSAIEYSPLYSRALGSGFRVGFLGALHADVVRERIEREFGLEVVFTPPQIEFRKKGSVFMEPYVRITLITPPEYLNRIIEIFRKRRAKPVRMDSSDYVLAEYDMPLSEMVGSFSFSGQNFFEEIKSASSGYASFDWEFLEYRETDADELEILINGEAVEEFSIIVVQQSAQEIARAYTAKLRSLIPRQLFEVRIQAKFKGRIIASERIPPFRRDVTGHLYGGDRRRKDKLLKKQKEGKKKLKALGKIKIPKEVFLNLFK